MLTCLLDCYARAYPVLRELNYRIADIDDSWVTLEGPCGQIGLSIVRHKQRSDTTYEYVAELRWHNVDFSTPQQHDAWHVLEHAITPCIHVVQSCRCRTRPLPITITC